MKCEQLWEMFKKYDFTYFTGVPDSTFKSWMNFLDDMHDKGLTNRVAVIERDAIGWAAGYYTATKKVGVVYMQNSGLGNTVNPITSLADPKVYNIPMLLLIGWRGEPGKHDEPQHMKMGEVTLPLLDVLGIRYECLPPEAESAEKVLAQAKKYIYETNGIYALVIKEGSIEEYEKMNKFSSNYEMTREDAIKAVTDSLPNECAIISTTGKASRELFEYREEKKTGHQNDFLMVGSMGLAACFGAEIALHQPKKRVYIFDGDGAVMMSSGTLSTIGYYAPKNLNHIIFDNETYESTGGQPTNSKSVDFEKLALANGYKRAKTVMTRDGLVRAIAEQSYLEGPQMLIVKVKNGSRKNLGRPTTTPIQNLTAFMDFLHKE
jgi:phosphonopyruvate decarboxylase